MDLATRALHGAGKKGSVTQDVTPPIHLSTTFHRDDDGGYSSGFSYTRSSNPNRVALEATLASLEGGAACATFGSGTQAALALFLAQSAGDHALVPADIYYGFRETIRKILPRWKLDVDHVDMTDERKVRAALRPTTKLLWVESPSNPTMKVTDIARVVVLAREIGASVVVDNTVPTPVLQQPLAMGADFVMHSTTKYLNGHSDVLGGAVIAREEGPHFQRVRDFQVHGGGVPSPFDCWLLLRGVRTVVHRVRAQSATALRIATFLATQPKIERVHYAGLPSHPQHALAARQMAGFGGLLSFEVRGGAAGALNFARGLQLIGRATSLGGVESLIEHRASVEGPDTTTPAGLLRLSVGLEGEDDLLADLRQALEAFQP